VQAAASRISLAPSSQDLNDRKRDGYGNGERNEEIARHPHRFVFMPRPSGVIQVALQVSPSSATDGLENTKLPRRRVKLAAEPFLLVRAFHNPGADDPSIVSAGAEWQGSRGSPGCDDVPLESSLR
jgi:hypothetical protein